MTLSSTFCENSAVYTGAHKNGDKYADGEGLYLHVFKNGSKYWRMNYRFNGKQLTYSIGVFPSVKLKEAREARRQAKDLLEKGIDPSKAKKHKRVKQRVESENNFQKIALEFHQKWKTNWSDGHAKKWKRMCEIHLFKTLGDRPIKDIETGELTAALDFVVDQKKYSTAQDLQQMITQVFRFAVQRGYIKYNPAQELKGSLPSHTPVHYAAIIDSERMGELLLAIDNYGGTILTTSALKLSALLFQRPGNIRAMRWQWIDFNKSIIKIPALEMKREKNGKINGKPHLVPLAKQAIDILKTLQPLTQHRGEFVFPSMKSAKICMSENTLNKALRSMGYTSNDHVSHGFRATARTIIPEEFDEIDPALIESQLAHSKNGPLGDTYDRAQYVKKRAALMQKWADYCDQIKHQFSNKNE